jgi:hypothetical protein
MITHVVSADRVIVRNRRTGAVEEVPIGNIQLAPTAGSEEQRKLDLSLIRNQDRTVAQMRYEAIQPLLEARQMDALLLKEVAERNGGHQATIFRWSARALRSGETTDGADASEERVERGNSRLKLEVDAVINAAIIYR